MKTKPPVHRFREAHTIDQLPENLRTEQYLIPMIVKDMGQLIGLEADARHVDWDADTLERETQEAYIQLASETALLLSLYGIEVISDEAGASVAHRLAASVDPLVSLHARVDHLFRAYIQKEQEQIHADVQRLWAALEFRCEAVTGQTFAQVLAED